MLKAYLSIQRSIYYLAPPRTAEGFFQTMSDTRNRLETIVAVQSNQVWLPQTQTWIYSQVRNIGTPVESHVICRRTTNLDQFTVPYIHIMKLEPWWRRFWNRLQRLSVNEQWQEFFVRTARRLGARLLHSHFGDVGWCDLEIARLAGLKQVVTFYGYDVAHIPDSDPVWRERYRDLFQRVDAVLCEGPHMAREIVGLGCPPAKVCVHHLGVDISKIGYLPKRWQPGEVLRVLIAATFVDKKGIPDALEALGRWQHQQEVQITIIGDAYDNPVSQAEKQRILETIDRHSLGPRVKLLGFQPHAALFQEAAQHHIFLSPSRVGAGKSTEGGAPVTIVEMMAAGILCVSTTHCDIPNVIQHGVTGLLSPEGDVDALGTSLQWLVANPQAWDGMIRAARDRVEGQFNATVQGQRLSAIYAAVIEGNDLLGNLDQATRQLNHPVAT